MDISDIKNKIASQPSSSALARLIADSWKTAGIGLTGISDDDYRNVSVKEYPLQMLCIVISQKDDYNTMSSAEKEMLTEKVKRVFEAVGAYMADGKDWMNPGYTAVASLIPKDGEKTFFDLQTKEDFKRLTAPQADALATALYGIVYAFYQGFDGTVDRCLKTIVGDSYEIGAFSRMNGEEQENEFNESVKKVFNAPQTNAGTSAAAPAYMNRSPNIRGRWRPLKIYLIVSTLFVALVVGLVFWSMASGIGSSGIGITDVNGESVSVEPGMEPVEVMIFGMVDYEGVLGIIKTTAVVFVIWRILLTAAVFVINYRIRRKAANRP